MVICDSRAEFFPGLGDGRLRQDQFCAERGEGALRARVFVARMDHPPDAERFAIAPAVERHVPLFVCYVTARKSTLSTAESSAGTFRFAYLSSLLHATERSPQSKASFYINRTGV